MFHSKFAISYFPPQMFTDCQTSSISYFTIKMFTECQPISNSCVTPRSCEASSGSKAFAKVVNVLKTSALMDKVLRINFYSFVLLIHAFMFDTLEISENANIYN